MGDARLAKCTHPFTTFRLTIRGIGLKSAAETTAATMWLRRAIHPRSAARATAGSRSSGRPAHSAATWTCGTATAATTTTTASLSEAKGLNCC
jgi:hypothetical protein